MATKYDELVQWNDLIWSSQALKRLLRKQSIALFQEQRLDEAF